MRTSAHWATVRHVLEAQIGAGKGQTSTEMPRVSVMDSVWEHWVGSAPLVWLRLRPFPLWAPISFLFLYRLKVTDIETNVREAEEQKCAKKGNGWYRIRHPLPPVHPSSQDQWGPESLKVKLTYLQNETLPWNRTSAHFRFWKMQAEIYMYMGIYCIAFHMSKQSIIE